MREGHEGAGETSDVDKEMNRDFPGREIGGLSERARTASCKHSSVRGPNRSHVVGAAPPRIVGPKRNAPVLSDLRYFFSLYALLLLLLKTGDIAT